MPPPAIYLDEVEAHDATRARVHTGEAFVDISEFPLLAGLSLDLGILEGTLQNSPC